METDIKLSGAEGTSTQMAVSNGSVRRISTLAFDPTKIQKKYILSDESDWKLLDEFCEEGLLCQSCGEKFNTQQSLAMHMRFHSEREGNHSSEKQRGCAETTNTAFDEDYDVENSPTVPRKVYKHRHLKYECSLCQKRFSAKESIRAHMKMHTGETPFQCPLCSKRFGFGSNLFRHLTAAHSDRDEHAEELCAKIIRETYSNENRMIEFTGEKPKPYKCGFCSKTFRRLYRVKSHTRGHTGQKPFQCSVCNKVFSSSDCLYRHVKRLHNGGVPIPKIENTKVEEIEEPETEKVKDLGNDTTIIQIDDGSGATFSIPLQQSASNELTFLHNPRQGGEVFTIDENGENGSGPTYYIDLRASELTPAQHLEVQMVEDHPEIRQHLPDHNVGDDNDDQQQQLTETTTHLPGKAFQCSMCGESFVSSPLLNKHISTHKFQIPCKCQICGKVFKQESYLKRHMVCHTEERPFKCTYCPKAYKRQYRLCYHLRSHTGERPYTCSVCNKAFTNSDNLYKHIKKVHKGVGLEYAVALVKQVQDMYRAKKYEQLYGDFEVLDEEQQLG